MIGIIGAMQIEIDRILERVEAPVKRVESGIEYVSGKLLEQDAVVAKCGIGKVNAAACAQTMALLFKPELVLNTGVAGSLSSELGVGDIAVGTDVVQHDVDTTALGDPPGMVSTVNIVHFPLDPAAREAILSAAEALPGVRAIPARIASGDQFVAASARKAEIVRLFDAGACEMEAGAIAQICHLNGIRCAVLRAISDGGDEGAHLSYAEFLPLAAKNSAELVLRFLSRMSGS
ncbi:MAG: 5'-methylthioadenosine/adenosylhomocysteine nucleosidase [Clostridiales bacterium]|nr:5'-methylthioadenosine/adenosylhomocysteine nucleosidase [Clostridiales bacterium]OPZ67419.1 MAG: 5'-methylthioadenosine/S-adenosylhomocysteine nucleosidase [Firmicutes bacterium ADurb.Bin467]